MLRRCGGRFLAALLMGFMLLVPCSPAQASGAEVHAPALTQNSEAVILTGSFGLSLSPALVDAVNHGIPLVFQMEVELKRARWYWTDEILYRARINRRLTFNTLVRNYRVTEGSTGSNFLNLEDAVAYIARPVEWRLPAGQARTGETIDVALRFRLDPAFLPKPFQVVSIGDRDWRIDSDWRNFRMTVPTVMGAK